MTTQHPIPTGALQDPAPKTCAYCGAGFQPTRKYPQQRFCSRRCGLKATLPAGHNARVARESAAKRGDALRGSGEGKAYRKRDGRHEHRGVAEEKLGRPLRPGEVVHHVDGNKLNNEPPNIEVLASQSDHARLHFTGSKQSADHVAKRMATTQRTKQAKILAAVTT